jgi:hypothetical protein
MQSRPASEALKPSDTPYTDTETARRADAALRRALNTPPQPKHGKGKESKAPKDTRRTTHRKDTHDGR